ncbi:MAG TPA: hypothetical protein VE692_00525 [Nitrososphaera sp.]|jgi:hypothetical protein|nr:hypothetical protein [Nitrososphaera sp.]
MKISESKRRDNLQTALVLQGGGALAALMMPQATTEDGAFITLSYLAGYDISSGLKGTI